MGLIAGHGYSPRRAALSTLLFAAAGAVLLTVALSLGLIVFVPVEIDLVTTAPPTRYLIGLPSDWLASLPAWLSALKGLEQHTLVQAPHGCPALVTPLYALDLIVPLLDLGQESSCRLETPGGIAGGSVQAARALYQILGAVMTAILITTLTGVLRRD